MRECGVRAPQELTPDRSDLGQIMSMYNSALGEGRVEREKAGKGDGVRERERTGGFDNGTVE